MIIPPCCRTLRRANRRSGLIVARSEQGLCRVLCFSPRHDLTVPLDSAELRLVVDLWVEQFRTLGSMSFVNYVLVFENRGAIMGASNPHPHCQFGPMPRCPMKSVPNRIPSWNIASGSDHACCATTYSLNSRWESASFARTKALWPWFRTGRCGLLKRSFSAAGTSGHGSTDRPGMRPPGRHSETTHHPVRQSF